MKKSKFNLYRFLLAFLYLVCYPFFCHVLCLFCLAIGVLVVCSFFLLLMGFSGWKLLYQGENHYKTFITILAIILGAWGVSLNLLVAAIINEKSQMDKDFGKNFEILDRKYFGEDEDDKCAENLIETSEIAETNSENGTVVSEKTNLINRPKSKKGQ